MPNMDLTKLEQMDQPLFDFVPPLQYFVKQTDVQYCVQMLKLHTFTIKVFLEGQIWPTGRRLPTQPCSVYSTSVNC